MAIRGVAQKRNTEIKYIRTNVSDNNTVVIILYYRLYVFVPRKKKIDRLFGFPIHPPCAHAREKQRKKNDINEILCEGWRAKFFHYSVRIFLFFFHVIFSSKADDIGTTPRHWQKHLRSRAPLSPLLLTYSSSYTMLAGEKKKNTFKLFFLSWVFFATRKFAGQKICLLHISRGSHLL